MPVAKVICKCGKRRGVLPGDVLVCSRCDYDHDRATVIPNENHVKEAPPGWRPSWLR